MVISREIYVIAVVIATIIVSIEVYQQIAAHWHYHPTQPKGERETLRLGLRMTRIAHHHHEVHLVAGNMYVLLCVFFF